MCRPSTTCSTIDSTGPRFFKHDLLPYTSQNDAKYDHSEFPGVVPRYVGNGLGPGRNSKRSSTFLGPLAVASVLLLVLPILNLLKLEKFWTLFAGSIQFIPLF
jgi:hypothetical protein